MQAENTLGLRVVVITIVTMLVLLGIYSGIKWVFFTDRSQDEIQSANELLAIDSDNDGVPDALESLFKTDASNPDTDGDGVTDGDELALKRNPAVAGPDDSLSDTVGPVTEKYISQLPSSADPSMVLDPNRLAEYVNQAQDDLLPVLASGVVKITTEEGKEAIVAYLDAISPSHNTAITFVDVDDINTAFTAQRDTQNTQPMTDIVIALEKNYTAFVAISAPEEVSALHTKLISASQALLTNTQALQNIQDDFVGGLISAKNLEELTPVFAEISNEIRALETKYELE